jgi:hypothetical protein
MLTIIKDKILTLQIVHAAKFFACKIDEVTSYARDMIAE